ncbi:uncharacterized protein LOC124150034 [Haliotis rufescens]|uniref:uncharacterized protein LOC124150034 n=1 Tax=Haliotis rufescens TaxID=6454 RepID=UPI001EAF9ED7|nr:uncharacterized protein LOC124150034 [Haliotis rufescens]
MIVAVLFVCILLSGTLSGLIMPTSKPQGSVHVDLTTLLSHVDRLQQTVTNLQTTTATLQASKVQAAADIAALNKQVASLKSQLTSKTVLFHVGNPAGTTALRTDAYTPVNFGHVDKNLGSGYNMTSGTFIAPVSGTYLFYLQLDVFKRKNADMFVFMKKQYGIAYTATELMEVGPSAVAVHHLDQWEEVGVIPEQPSYYYDAPASYFGGVLLSAD